MRNAAYTRCPENDSGNQHLIEHVETNKKVHWHISIGCIIKKLLTIKNYINNSGAAGGRATMRIGDTGKMGKIYLASDSFL